jgi:hypothetical protein
MVNISLLNDQSNVLGGIENFKESNFKVFKDKLEKIQLLNNRMKELKRDHSEQFKNLLDESISKVHEFITSEDSNFMNYFVIYILQKIIERLTPDLDSLQPEELKWNDSLLYSIASLKSLKLMLNLNPNLALIFNQMNSLFVKTFEGVDEFLKIYRDELFPKTINFINACDPSFLLSFNQYLKSKPSVR